MNQQKLARSSRVSDSEVSRILGGKALPGLENAFRLAKAVGASLDFLADDALEEDPLRPACPATEEERALLKAAQEMGHASAIRLLDIARVLGYEVAIRRLVGAESRPHVEVADAKRPSAPPAPNTTLVARTDLA